MIINKWYPLVFLFIILICLPKWIQNNTAAYCMLLSSFKILLTKHIQISYSYYNNDNVILTTTLRYYDADVLMQSSM